MQHWKITIKVAVVIALPLWWQI